MGTHIVGIDPGLVDTGVVSIIIDDENKSVVVHKDVVGNGDMLSAARHAVKYGTPTHIFVEGYRPRMKLNTDRRMIQLVAQLMMHLPPGAKDLDNMGVKKVIRQKLMEIFEVWQFNTVTNHQDLRSAARIALFGAVKDKELNHLLGQVVVDYLDGKPWQVTHA